MPKDTNQAAGKAVLYRMVMEGHLCPYGLKSKDLLEREGYEVEDHHLTTREETDAFKAEHNVSTTPQTFIGGTRIGGYDALREHFGKEVKEADETTYQPVIAISMCFLAVQKLKDVEGFSTMFLNYDLLAQRWVRYGYIYPFGEAIAGVLMVAGALVWISAPIALVIGTIGPVSVFKAVYIDGRELKCACVGGGSNVPLGFVSLTENLMMIFMGVWMPARALGWI